VESALHKYVFSTPSVSDDEATGKFVEDVKVRMSSISSHFVIMACLLQ